MPGEDIQSWSTTAAINSNADTLINFAEGQARASVNDSARSMMAAHAKDRVLRSGTLTTGGSANAHTFISGVGYTSIPTGLRVLLRAGATNTGPTTLNMDGIGTIGIRSMPTGAELVGGELTLNSYFEVGYDGSFWILLNDAAQKLRITGGTLTGNLTIGNLDPAVNLVKTVSGHNNVIGGYTYTAAFPRWILVLGDSTAEGGSDTGSNFALFRYNDGAVATSAFNINRATGEAVLGAGLTIGGNLSAPAGSVFSIGHLNAGFDITAGRDVIATRNLFAHGHVFADFDITATRNIIASVNGFKPGGGAWADSSDARIKNVVGDYGSGLKAITQLRPVRYTFKGNDSVVTRDTGKEYIGLVAQEAEQHMPEMVTHSNGKIDGADVNDLRLLDTSALIFALVNAVKELTHRLEALEAK